MGRRGRQSSGRGRGRRRGYGGNSPSRGSISSSTGLRRRISDGSVGSQLPISTVRETRSQARAIRTLVTGNQAGNHHQQGRARVQQPVIQPDLQQQQQQQLQQQPQVQQPMQPQVQQPMPVADMLLQGQETSTGTLTWVIGDSIVARMGKYNSQLLGGGVTVWTGWPGYSFTKRNLLHKLQGLLRHNSAPNTLIVHIGTNDIFEAGTKEIRDKVEESLKDIRALLPLTRIIWSDIIVRLAYPREVKKDAGKTCVRSINKRAHKVCRKTLKPKGNARVITYSDLISPALRMIHGEPSYEYDCTHPTELGLELLRQRISQALTHFNSDPAHFDYPPGSAEAPEDDDD